MTIATKLNLPALKQQCRELGLDANRPPIFTEKLTDREFSEQLNLYNEVMAVIRFFVEKFLSSLPGSPMMVSVTDNKGHVLEFQGNPLIIDTVRSLGIEEGLRFTEASGINGPALCLKHEGPIQLIGTDHYHTVLHELVCYAVPFRRREEDNRIWGTIALMTDVNSGHPHLLALLCTIADSVERELRLRQQNTQLQILNQALLETNHYGVIVADAAGRVLEMNEQAQVMLQERNEDSVPGAAANVMDTKLTGAYFRRVLQEGETCIGEALTVCMQGADRHYILDVLPIYDAERRLSRVVGTLRDITEMKRTEQLLRNTEKLIFAGQLAVSIAHEIRNPLTTVKGMLQFAGKDVKRDHYDLMMSELDRMNLIVTEFMILGKPQSIKFHSEPCLPLLEEVVDIFEFQAKRNGIDIKRDFSQAVTSINCDRNQIKQAFLNILKNACEAMPYGGELDVVLDTVDEGHHRIRFKDNGEGISEEVLCRVGEPFLTTRSDGNGLGLMIVRRIVTAHQGHLEITSEVGKGTEVVILLPAAREPEISGSAARDQGIDGHAVRDEGIFGLAARNQGIQGLAARDQGI